MLFVISSPSGGGKGTLIRRLLEAVPGVSYSVSWTTRGSRPGEIDGVNYHFVSTDEFERMRASGGFLEWAVVHGHLYGTARSVVEQDLSEGHDIILEIDVQGAASVRATMSSVVSVFILPPSFEVLRARLTARMTERPEELELRLRNARGEVEQYRHFDYLVLNDEVGRAAAQLASIVSAERARRERQEWVARRVLATFT
ncbi:MAG: guanylate kinase [Acidobacteria bacterium]|nr:MAG: guanylate kinase [Acidobacteriota bacterium]PYS85581.1 MAG: guanylate kinase [Acidobacteriota bacterium]